MLTDLYRLLPPEGVKILVVLFLSFLTGLEREERRPGAGGYTFGGVRTFPLIALVGYAVSLLSPGQVIPIVAGLGIVAAFLLFSYQHKLASADPAGMTTEMSALTTYLVGALVQRDQIWIATTIAVASILLLELKTALQELTRRIVPDEILTFTKFLLLTAVVLPVLPNQAFGPFQINPFKSWLVVVAVSTVSYGSYVIQKLTKGQGGVLLAAVLGGAYSSTVTTVVLSKRAAHEDRPHLFSGGILMASGMMYLRLAGLVTLFNRAIMTTLGPPFLALAAVALIVGWVWARIPDANTGEIVREFEPKNPLELRAAFFFGALFLAMLVATHLAVSYLGTAGAYTLGALMGLADVDPFIMGMTESAGAGASLSVASAAILIAASSNNFAKGIYAFTLCDRKTGIRGLVLLAGLAAAGLVPLVWLLR